MMTLHEFLEACRAEEVQLYLARSPLDPEDIGSVILLARDKEKQLALDGVPRTFPIVVILVALNSIHVCLSPINHRRSWYYHQIGALGYVPTCAECWSIREALAPELWKRLREHRQED